ncbi:EAL domain-containing protein [Anoxybacillus sp. LAT_35]|uniref:putative bifunctional diguanylate cyclase/phosphodiesterase n=1 Tax=unclassified Anoxybacillus TaxID=2639704 RepID=UPI001EEC1603|nr:MULTISPECIES: EAL domain-containing protein [unclassified Anoxybacillus]MCG6172343.1 EAL domain-containing protein [Anoxybacillus sp. LAT_11]MCG6177889.1 EAL domain-containing protein [Anoxybacillus sp. LAT_35]
MTKKEKRTIMVSVLAVICFLTILLFRSSLAMTFERNHFLSLHTLLEFFSITVAMAIAFQGWISFPQALSRRRLRIATTFLAVGFLDLLHTLTYKQMPGIVFADSSVQLTASFWLAARLTQAIFLLLAFLLPDGPIQEKEKFLAFVVPLLYVGLLSAGIVHVADSLPPLVIEGAGTTSLKNGVEYIITTLHIITIGVLIHHYKEKRLAPTLDVIVGLVFLFLSELIFTLYRNVYDVLNVLGHIYKVVGFTYFLRGLYLATFKEPFQARERAEQALAKSQEQLRKQALFDELTNLPNRRYFIDTLRERLEIAKQKNETVGLFFLDLDNFKNINDSLGHAAGDLLLQLVAKRLSHLHDHFVARLGGDEFAMIVPDVPSFEQVAQQMIDILGEPFFIRQKELFITTSLGISIYPTHGEDEMTLIQHADMAMYEAKKKGKNQWAMYDPAFEQERIRKSLIRQRLHAALEQCAISVYYQPIIDVKRNELVGMEALARWKDTELGFVPPHEFIHIAEEDGFIIPLGEYIFQTAVSHLKQLHEQGMSHVYVSINLSLRQLKNEQFLSFVQQLLKQTCLQPQYIELEITENIALSDEKQVIETIQALKQMGIRIAIDDFGSGYSSIAYLRHISVDTLKIDKSFIFEVITNEHTAKLTEAIIALAHRLQLHIVAEGVETDQHVSFLQSTHCDKAQGYLFSPPVPFEQMIKQLQTT